MVGPHCVISRWISAAGNYCSWTTTLGARPDAAGEIEKDRYTRRNTQPEIQNEKHTTNTQGEIHKKKYIKEVIHKDKLRRMDTLGL